MVVDPERRFSHSLVVNNVHDIRNPHSHFIIRSFVSLKNSLVKTDSRQKHMR